MGTGTTWVGVAGALAGRQLKRSAARRAVAEAMVPGSRSLERLTVKDAGGWGSVIALCGREDK